MIYGIGDIVFRMQEDEVMKRTRMILMIALFSGFLVFLVAPGDAFTWDVVLSDGWGDEWRLNKIREDSYAIYYSGEWEYRYGQSTKKGKAAAVLLKGDCGATTIKSNCEGGARQLPSGQYEEIEAKRPGMLTLTGFYDDGDTCYNVLYPYTAWYDDFKVYRWYGVRHWTRDSQYTNNIHMDVKEGQVWIYEDLQ